MLSRGFAHEVRRNRRIVGERLVEAPHDVLEHARHVGLHFVLVVVGPIARRHHARVRPFILVEAGVPGETNREGVDRIRAGPRHEGDDRARVDAPTEEGAERHLTDETDPDRFAHPVLELFNEVGFFAPAIGLEGQVPVGRLANLSFLD